jgi:cytochrome c biogenesis factor
MWVKPLVHFIWGGAILMALGAVVAMGGAFRLRTRGKSGRVPAEPGAVPLPAE